MSHPDDLGSPEDLLSNMFKSTGFGKGQDVVKMLSTLVRNVQIRMLKQLRSDIDRNIKMLTELGTAKMACSTKSRVHHLI